MATRKGVSSWPRYEEGLRPGAMEGVFQNAVEDAAARHRDRDDLHVIERAKVQKNQKQDDGSEENNLPVAKVGDEPHGVGEVGRGELVDEGADLLVGANHALRQNDLCQPGEQQERAYRQA